MGEGAESTPLAVISDIPFVEFTDHDPDNAELEVLYTTRDNDLFAPFLDAVPWQRGGGQ